MSWKVSFLIFFQEIKKIIIYYIKINFNKILSKQLQQILKYH